MNKYPVTLGHSGGIDVPYIFSEHGGNKHLAVFGLSGYGKSTLLTILAQQLISCGAKIIDIDYSDSSTEKRTITEYSRKIDISTNAPCSPFMRRYNVYGVSESVPDYAKRLSDIMSGALKLGSKQENTLYSIIRNAAMQDKPISFKTICLALNNIKGQSAYSLKIKMNYLADKNVFENECDSWDEIFQNKKAVQILSLSGFPAKERTFIAEMLLDDLKNYITERGTGNNDFFLILDECQKLSFRQDMPISFFMREGRKYGCGVWLATQSPNFFKRDELASVLQAGLVINFRPNENERKTIIKKLSTNDKEYKKLLELSQGLGCGQFIATGSFIKKNGNLSPRINLVIDGFNENYNG